MIILSQTYFSEIESIIKINYHDLYTGMLASFDAFLNMSIFSPKLVVNKSYSSSSWNYDSNLFFLEPLDVWGRLWISRGSSCYKSTLKIYSLFPPEVPELFLESLELMCSYLWSMGFLPLIMGRSMLLFLNISLYLVLSLIGAVVNLFSYLKYKFSKDKTENVSFLPFCIMVVCRFLVLIHLINNFIIKTNIHQKRIKSFEKILYPIILEEKNIINIDLFILVNMIWYSRRNRDSPQYSSIFYSHSLQNQTQQLLALLRLFKSISSSQWIYLFEPTPSHFWNYILWKLFNTQRTSTRLNRTA